MSDKKSGSKTKIMVLLTTFLGFVFLLGSITSWNFPSMSKDRFTSATDLVSSFYGCDQLTINKVTETKTTTIYDYYNCYSKAENRPQTSGGGVYYEEDNYDGLCCIDGCYDNCRTGWSEKSCEQSSHCWKPNSPAENDELEQTIVKIDSLARMDESSCQKAGDYWNSEEEPICCVNRESKTDTKESGDSFYIVKTSKNIIPEYNANLDKYNKLNKKKEEPIMTVEGKAWFNGESFMCVPRDLSEFIINPETFINSEFLTDYGFVKTEAPRHFVLNEYYTMPALIKAEEIISAEYECSNMSLYTIPSSSADALCCLSGRNDCYDNYDDEEECENDGRTWYANTLNNGGFMVKTPKITPSYNKNKGAPGTKISDFEGKLDFYKGEYTCVPKDIQNLEFDFNSIVRW